VTTRPDLSRDNYDNNYAAWQGSGTIERDDVPTTAKMVTVGLGSGAAPVVVRSDPQNIGDITTQAKRTVTIRAKITSDATEGEYVLPLTVGYTYLASSEQVAADVLQSEYRQVNETLPLTIRIKPQVRIGVTGVQAGNLTVGTGGYVTLTIRNLGFEDGRKATVSLLRNGNSPVIPTDSSIFVGDFPRDGTVTCRYKVSISTDAEKQTYPVDVAVTYENREGDVVTSATETIGIPVSSKVSFSVTPESATVVPGESQVVVVRYQNTGDIPVFSAQAKLSAVEPFTSDDNTAYLGDLKPGETVTVRYALTAAAEAVVKEYSLDTEVRYRDALENSQVSDTLKVPVRVGAKPGASGLMQVLPILGLLVLFGAGYYLLVIRKKL
jgi:hypothetical protein